MPNTPESEKRSLFSLPEPVKKELESQALSLVVQRLLAEMNKQPWWKKYSNTVTAIVAGLVVLAGWITTTGIDLPQWASAFVGVVLFVGSVLGIRTTKNGLTESVVEKVADIRDASDKLYGRHSSGQ